MSITHNKNKSKDTETEDLVAEYLANGGKITKLETRTMPYELGISNSTWNNKLTKVEKDAKEKK